MKIKAKKYLGQHFLRDQNIARKIVGSLQPEGLFDQVLEVGPGMGVLTDLLIRNHELETVVIDLDGESVEYLREKYPRLKDRILLGDFLAFDIREYFGKQVGIIGNFPYNISSQILFHVLDYRKWVPQVVGMFQKEVAERVASGPGSKEYGILSVLVQAFYQVEYLFTVNPAVFIPPPKVKSGVIRLKRLPDDRPAYNEPLFFSLVKAAFNQRRKTLRNALSAFSPAGKVPDDLLKQRAEQLSIDQFIELTKLLSA